VCSSVDLSEYDCDACSEPERLERGCHGDSAAPLWEDDPEHRCDVCPRRLILGLPGVCEPAPWISEVHALYRDLEKGRATLDADKLTAWVWDALSIVDEGVAHLTAERRREAERERMRHGD